MVNHSKSTDKSHPEPKLSYAHMYVPCCISSFLNELKIAIMIENYLIYNDYEIYMFGIGFKLYNSNHCLYRQQLQLH